MWNELKNKGPLLLMLDFDGTLVPLAQHPNAISPALNLRYLLDKLKEAHHEVWIISGRRIVDVQKFIGNQTPIIGLHGYEWPGQTLENPDPLLDVAFRQCQQLGKKYPGIVLEHKGLSVVIHFRQVSPSLKKQINQQSLEILEPYAGSQMSILQGKDFVELRPKTATKASACSKLMQLFPKHFPVYIGDDTTDEEAFRVVNKKGVTVRVEPFEETQAQFKLNDSQSVLEHLEALIT